MQIKTVMYHYTSIRMVKIQNITITNASKNVEDRNAHSLLLWKQK